MPGIDIRVAWVVKVEPHYLAAHVEAFVETLPSVNTLRLCHRFGKGPKAFINRLPKEIIEEFESWIVCPVRAQKLIASSQQYRCFRNKCTPLEHYSMAEQKRAYRYFFGASSMKGLPAKKGLSKKGKEKLSNEMDEDTNIRYHGLYDRDDDYNIYDDPLVDGWQWEHSAHRYGWLRKIGNGDESMACPFSKHDDLLHQYFGLHTWFSHKHKEDEDGDVCHTTMAYLILPSKFKLQDEWHPEEFDEGDEADEFYDTTDEEPRPHVFSMGYDRTLAIPKALTEAQKCQFGRAVKKLALKLPSKSQVNYIAAQESDVQDTKKKSKGKQHAGVEPVIKLLVSNGDDELRYD